LRHFAPQNALKRLVIIGRCSYFMAVINSRNIDKTPGGKFTI